jgi:PAS domain S-box-containing protein
MMSAGLITFDGFPCVIIITRDITEQTMKSEKTSQAYVELQHLYEVVPDLVCVASTDGYLKKVNAAWETTLGFSRGELLSKPYVDFIHPDDIEPTRRVIEGQAAGVAVIKFVNRYRTRDGNYRWLEWMSNPSPDGTTLYAVARDITERKAAEEAIAESEQRHRELLEKLPDGYYRSTHDGRFIEVNNAMVQILGYATKQELMSIDIKRELYFDEDDRESAALEETQVEMAVFPLKKKDGTKIWVEDHGRHVLGPNGDVLYHEGVLRDVSDRRREQQQVTMQAHLLDAALDSIFLVELDGTIVYANHEACASRGYGREELVGKNISSINDPVNAQQVPIRLKRVVREGKVVFESHHYRKDGSSFDVEVSARLVVLDGRQYILSINRDVTERKQTASELRKLVGEKEMLLQELKHRVKNNLKVLSSLLGLELARTTELSTRRVLIDARARITTMGKMYDQLSGSNNLDKVNLSLYIKDIANSLFSTYRHESAGIALRFQIDEVELDTKRAIPLGLILNELFTNILKYAFPNGRTGEVEISLLRRDDTLVVTVADNGVGLPINFSPEAAGSLGTQLIVMLTEQLEGTVKFERSGGTTCEIRFLI